MGDIGGIMEWNQIWTIVGANIVLTLGCIGTTITLFLWARHEAGEDRKENAIDRRRMADIMERIQNETKEFQLRMEKQDSDFKFRMEKQDADFKAHLRYEHQNAGV